MLQYSSNIPAKTAEPDWMNRQTNFYTDYVKILVSIFFFIDYKLSKCYADGGFY